jgi:pilus assembly protein CpaF
VSAPTAYRLLRADAMHRVQVGEIDPQGDRALVRAALATTVAEYQDRASLDDHLVALTDPQGMVDRLLLAVCEYGPLTALLERPDIEEIQIQGARVSYLSGGRWVRHAVPATEEENLTYVERLLTIAATSDRQLSAANPSITVGLQGFARLSVKIPPIVDELTVSIRKVVLRNPTLSRLVETDSLTPSAASLLHALMQIRSRVVVAGAPTAGKTTLTNALLSAIPATRVVRVNEEDRELYAQLMLGGYAMANERRGQTLRDLIKLDLRFRPDILVVGEVRGGEAFELLRPLNAGVGLLTTVHSNQASDTIDALATAAALAGEKISDETLRRLFAAAIDFVVFCDADEPLDGTDHHKRRQVTEIAWVLPQLVGGNVVYEPIFRREALGRPLRWTGATPDPATSARIERGLPRGVTLTSVLDGRRALGAIA